MDKNDYSYGWEKFHSAVHCLVGSGERKERLADAIVVLFHIRPAEQHLHIPKEILPEFNEFMKKMTSVGAVGNEGNVKATINTFDELTMSQAEKKIIGFYDTVCRYQEPYSS